MGTGGIGTGRVYRLEGDHELGRNESRPGHLLPSRDFCKLHIVLHYVSVLIRELGLSTRVYPIGAVGDDSDGKELIELMKTTGMNTKYVSVMKNTPTLHSVCFLYPDHSGGNITENRSASSKVVSGHVIKVESILKNKRSIVLSVPEVPLPSRSKLIRLGSATRAFVLASFVSEELKTPAVKYLLRRINLLSVNMGEAAALGEISEKAPIEKIIQACIRKISNVNQRMKLCITCGSRGMYGYENGRLEFLPAFKVPVVNSAGAGDAVLSGLIMGLILGFPFSGGKLPTCLRAGRMLSALSVTSPDTINFDIDLKGIRKFQIIHNEHIF